MKLAGVPKMIRTSRLFPLVLLFIFLQWQKILYIRSEVFTAVIMKNAVFWDINTQFIPHRRHYVSVTETSRIVLCKI
jgi:hypothetical protein